jgi:hypothetical protein
VKIVILDGYTLNPGDLSWKELQAMGKVSVYERTPEELNVERSTVRMYCSRIKCRFQQKRSATGGRQSAAQRAELHHYAAHSMGAKKHPAG